MKKPHSYEQVAENHRCNNCNKPLKLNLLDKLPGAKKCYYCFLLEKGITTIGKRSVRSKVLVNKKTYRLA